MKANYIYTVIKSYVCVEVIWLSKGMHSPAVQTRRCTKDTTHYLAYSVRRSSRATSYSVGTERLGESSLVNGYTLIGNAGAAQKCQKLHFRSITIVVSFVLLPGLHNLQEGMAIRYYCRRSNKDLGLVFDPVNFIFGSNFTIT